MQENETRRDAVHRADSRLQGDGRRLERQPTRRWRAPIREGDDTMSETKKVALPAYLPRRLQAFRIVQRRQHLATCCATSWPTRPTTSSRGSSSSSRCCRAARTSPSCSRCSRTASAARSPRREVLRFFGWLADNKLLDEESAAHPLLKPFTQQSYALEQGLVKPKSFEELARSWRRRPAQRRRPPRRPAPPRRAAGDDGRRSPRTRRLPAGVNEVGQPRPARRRRPGIRCSRSGRSLAALLPVVAPLKWVVYLMPLPRPVGADPGVRYAPLGVRRPGRRCTT